MPDIRFLSIRLRAFAQSTEVAERVLGAMVFASGTDRINVAVTEGHFGNPITVFEAELKGAGDMKRFMGRMEEAGILAQLRGQEDARTDDENAFHFRLDKQRAYLGELALASGRDVIDVRLKVATYPARREAAVRELEDWLSQQGHDDG